MGATLDALHRLQVIETQLRSLRGQIESRHRSVRARQRRLASIDNTIQDIKNQITQAQAEADRLELDRQRHEEHVGKLREALNLAKTNKEYAAVLSQLNTDKADAMKAEDAALTALGKVDDLKKQMAEQQATLDTEKNRTQTLEKAASDLEASLADQVNELERQRDEAADEITPQALHLFERACDRHDGEGLAQIEQVHPKRAEYICTGCHMSITLETVNALQSSGDEVRACETCNRILYLEAPTGVTSR